MSDYAVVIADDVKDLYAGTSVPGEFRRLGPALGCDQLAITLIRVPPHSDFEQNFHVRHRLERYGAGRCMDFEIDGPGGIAAAIAAEIGRAPSYRPVERPGAARAAEAIAELL